MAKPAGYIGKEQAIQKLKQYCAYQERCHSEVKNKLAEYGLFGEDADEVAALLIEENYLNEERFALAFVSGKYRLKQWGKTKIKYELQAKKVSTYCINLALKSIESEAYDANFKKLFDKKLATLKSEKNIFTKKTKLRSYLLSKGYEHAVITNELNKL
jgi:regulatory protein